MPPAVAAAAQIAVPAATQIGGQLLAQGGQKRAMQAEEQARRDALNFERERMQHEYQRDMARYNAYRQLAQRYGIDIPEAASVAPVSPPMGGGQMRRPVSRPIGGQPTLNAPTLGGLMGQPPPEMADEELTPLEMGM